MASGIKNTPEVFWSKVDKTEGCWLWTGALESNGYGRFSLHLDGEPRRWGVHALAYTLTYGFVPEGHQVNHTCGNRACVNPDHLYSGTQSMNMVDSIEHGTHRCARATQCPRGHAYDEENTYVRPSGARVCRACARTRDRERWPARAAAGSKV